MAFAATVNQLDLGFVAPAPPAPDPEPRSHYGPPFHGPGDGLTWPARVWFGMQCGHARIVRRLAGEPYCGECLMFPTGAPPHDHDLEMGRPESVPPTLTDRSVKSIGDALREFGYTGLTDDEVRETGNRLLAGGDPSGDVIAMFMAGMLRDAGLLTEAE